jgi:hypothetical protein
LLRLESLRHKTSRAPAFSIRSNRWFGKISAEHERLRLDNFAIALQENPDWIGIYLFILTIAPVTLKDNAARTA